MRSDPGDEAAGVQDVPRIELRFDALHDPAGGAVRSLLAGTGGKSASHAGRVPGRSRTRPDLRTKRCSPLA